MIYQYIYLKKSGVPKKDIALYFMMMIPFAIIGGKMLTIFNKLDAKNINIFNAGLSSYGGAAGVILSSFIYEKINPHNGKVLKTAILSLPLIYGISKMGCFLAGCCHGIPYTGPFNIRYDKLGKGSYFPIQIVETISFILTFLTLNWLDKKNTKNIIGWCIISSAVLKFGLDFLRYSHIKEVISTNQIISILFVISVVIYIWYVKKKKLTSD